MPFREFSKNTREFIRVGPTLFEGHDLIDIRVYARDYRTGELAPTKRGISLNLDTVPELVDSLFWALGQACNDDSDLPERRLAEADAAALADVAWDCLRKHGRALHWDSVERMALGGDDDFTKWDLHYVLATRSDLFERVDRACYRARDRTP